MARLLDRDFRALLLVVVITPALWNSMVCLREICTAIDNKIKIYPMFLEGPIPPKSEIWPMSNKVSTDMEKRAKHMLMVNKAWEGLYRANCFPPPNVEESGIAKNPHLLDRSVMEIEGMLGALKSQFPDRAGVGSKANPKPNPKPEVEVGAGVAAGAEEEDTRDRDFGND